MRVLLAAGAASLALLGGGSAVLLTSSDSTATAGDQAVFCSEFKPNEEATWATGKPLAKWAAQNPGERDAWSAFAVAICSGASPAEPSVATAHGKAIVAAGALALPELPPPTSTSSTTTTTTTAPPPPTAWGPPITITSGGNYTLNAESTSTAAAVTIATSQPVTLTGRARNLYGGKVIDAVPGGPVQVTVDHMTLTGGATYTTSGRALEAYDFKSITVRDSTLENTRGIELTYGVAGSSVLITRNRQHNIQGWNNPAGDTDVGNFVQFRVCQNATIEVSWNEIVNEYGTSEPTDIISVYFTRNAFIHDNYLQHQSRIGNLTPSSQNSITLEGDARLDGNRVIDNQVVDAFGIGVFGGANNLLQGNRIVADQYLPGGAQKANGHGAPLYMAAGSGQALSNTVGYIDASGAKTDFNLPGQSGGNNVSMPLPITSATEQAEWTRWQQKVAAAGISIGA